MKCLLTLTELLATLITICKCHNIGRTTTMTQNNTEILLVNAFKSCRDNKFNFDKNPELSNVVKFFAAATKACWGSRIFFSCFVSFTKMIEEMDIPIDLMRLDGTALVALEIFSSGAGAGKILSSDWHIL